MILSSGTKKPKIHPSAYVAPSATVSGDVTIEADCAVLHGAVLSSEGAPILLGTSSVVMENAVLKASGGKAMQFPLRIGARCIVGPGAYVVGATVAAGCFIAAGAKVFNGATMAEGTSVALGGIVHVRTHLASGQHVPMQHVAFGDPATIYPPDRAGEVRERLGFFETVFNIPQSDDVRAKAASAYAAFLRASHAQDAIVDDGLRKAAPKPPPRKHEEPPPTQVAEVDKVVDVMFFELQEMERRRKESIERGKKPR